MAALRWRAPRPIQPWTETLDSSVARGAAAQVLTYSDRPPGIRLEGELIGSEDCLCLSVWSPRSSPPSGGWPVMVWLHGGGNVSGSGSDVDAGQLSVTQDVVVVTVTHRLGLLGWFAHQALFGVHGTDEDRSGNFATLDQIAALRWVQEGIAAFGGNPDQVTIFGQSSGGWNVRALLCSPKAKGLFHRAIIQSVGAFQTMSLAHAENFIDDDVAGHPLSACELVRSLWLREGRSPDAQAARRAIQAEESQSLGAWLRSQSVAALFAAQRMTQKRNAKVGSHEGVTPSAARRLPQMFRDGLVVTDEIQSKVPVIIGMTRDEDRAFLSSDPSFVTSLFGAPVIRDPQRFSRLSDALRRLFWAFSVHDVANAFARDGLAVFVYRFDWDNVVSPAGIDLRPVLGACHGIELPLLFGSIDLTRDVAAMRHLFDVKRTDFVRLSEAVMSYWASFARSGIPSAMSTLPHWPRWDGDRYLVLDESVRQGVRAAHGSVGSTDCVAELAREMQAVQSAARRTCGEDLRRYPNCRLTKDHYRQIDPETMGADP